MKLKIELPSHAAEVLRRMYESGELEAIGIVRPDKQHPSEKIEPDTDILARYAPHTIHVGTISFSSPKNGFLAVDFTDKIIGLYPATIGRKDTHYTTPDGEKFADKEIVLAEIRNLNSHLEDYYSFNLERIIKTPPKDRVPSSN
jgi:hypothetical protein